MKPQGNSQLNLPSQNQTRVTRERGGGGGGGGVGVGEMEAEVAWSGLLSQSHAVDFYKWGWPRHTHISFI